MDIFSALWADFLFALACNLDTALAAVGQGARGTQKRRWEALGVAVVTTGVTALSLFLGSAGGALLHPALADRLGGLALTALGLWYLLDALRGKGASPADGDKGWLALSAALAVNNAGVGVAAGVTGLAPAVASACNFVVTLAALALGHALGARLSRWSGLALPVSGAILIALGLWQMA